MSWKQTINQAGVRAVTTGPGVRTDLLRRGIRVQSQARRNLTARRPGVDTGRLRASVAVSETTSAGVPVVRVGTNVEYAIYVHEGTRYMRGNPFLRDALSAASG